MGLVTGIPAGSDFSGNVTSPAPAGGVPGFESDFFQTTHQVIFDILNKTVADISIPPEFFTKSNIT